MLIEALFGSPKLDGHPYSGTLLSNERNEVLIHSMAWVDLQNIRQKEARHRMYATSIYLYEILG